MYIICYNKIKEKYMALATADIHIKVDPAVKREAEKNLKSYGISMSDLINVTLRGFNRERRMPYETEKSPAPAHLTVDNYDQLKALILEAMDKDDSEYYTSDEIRQSLARTRERFAREKI